MLKRERIKTVYKSLGKSNGQYSAAFESPSVLRIKQAAASGKQSFPDLLESYEQGLSAAEVRGRLSSPDLNEVAQSMALLLLANTNNKKLVY